MRIMPLVATLWLAFNVFAEPAITGVTAVQRYPWNGKVDISYTVTGDIEAEAKQRGVFTSLKVSAIDKSANTTNIATQLSGDTNLTVGTHQIVWDMAAEGLDFKSSNVLFRVSCETIPALYCVIDLSSGASASSYPVTYLAESPSGGVNTDEYKTTKLVLKRIEAGTFIMGDDQTNESQRVILTKPFYMGIFEVTEKQYQLVVGSKAYYPKHSMVCVSYNEIRSNFIGRLRTRTGLVFDLPTEAQWEYACRAGTTTRFSYGNGSSSSFSNYMWYLGNSDSALNDVGTKRPNPWGLYDMHGNVVEWCLDWDGDLMYGIDPTGSSSGTNRVYRGGSWYDNGRTSYNRGNRSPSYGSNSFGFRLSWTLAD
ncbi:MAG: SUMF1/EgtB/PvdO family nonheme iron enzyme [Kiritimatiellae bacterium]|nr:SUMF1/EgtB/PvdO family nonheme iron enzyme [Kiritimatiellia bacterium]